MVLALDIRKDQLRLLVILVFKLIIDLLIELVIGLIIV